ncbi:MAG: ferredoxin--NADP reductase [Chitinophagaceae bacterium]
MQPWQQGKVIAIEQAAPATKRFFIEVDDVFNFEPGQFVTLDLPIHEQKNKRWRSYSIASSPNNSKIFELVIVWLEGGAGTTYLFNEVTVGTILNLRGPQGKFVLPQQIDKDLFLICTGTGVAPFRSMVNFLHQNALPTKNIYLVFGCRTLNDCLYKNELLDLQNAMPNFFYNPCFSREEAVEPWANKGYVHSVYESIVEKNKTNETLKPATFFLCGWKNMIDEAKQRIQQLGYDKHDIHLELYG